MPKIFVHNEPYEVRVGQNLLHACLSLGFNIPYFCWHPALNSVGACRQCAVKLFKDENDAQGRVVMSCMTPVTDGMRISIDDPDVRAFRGSIIEWLMTNHPHDCPICDEGGECHLQDMTVMTGHTYRRYRFQKRTYNNQDLGPFVNHEMNRCIQCYRCVRFYRDYAGGRDFGVFGCHNHVYFGRHEDGVLDNEFSGNLVEVCPTGVFTDKTLKQHYTRPWDLQRAPSICVHCGVGCNITPCERYGKLRRVRCRYNGEVNGYFLCDRGRFGYEFVNGGCRVRQIVQRAPDSTVTTISKADALRWLKDILPQSSVIGIGSPRASLESNFALRALVGADRFYAGVPEPEHALTSAMIGLLRTGPARTPTLREIGEADAVFVLGEDVTNVAPMIALRLRQSVRIAPMKIAQKLNIPSWDEAAVREAVQQAKGPLYLATLDADKLDDIATRSFRATPDDLARLGSAVAHAIDPEAPSVPDLAADPQTLAEEIAKALAAAQRPLVIAGPSCGSEAVLQAAANVARALYGKNPAAALSFTTPECNTLGLGLIGGGSLDDAFKFVDEGRADTVIILENDLYRRTNRATADALLQKARHVIVLDHVQHDTTARAELVLPASAFPEGDGTLVNHEGRAQRFVQVYVPEGGIQESWRWLEEMQHAGGRDLDAVLQALAAALPAFGPVLKLAPPASARFAGQRIPRQPHRYSGRTAMNANVAVSERKIQEDPDSPLTFSMEGYRGTVPSAMIPFFWAPGWNSVQAFNKFQEEIAGPLRGGDPGVRLIEPSAGTNADYYCNVPAPFAAREAERLILPLQHIFGSEELSMRSPAIAQRAPAAYLALNPADASAWNIAEGDTVELRLGDTLYRLRVEIRSSLPMGAVGVPAGFAELNGAALPGWGAIKGLG